MDATKEVPIVGTEGDNAAAAADIDLNLEDFVDMEINGSEADLDADAENEDGAGSDEGVSNETEDIAVKLQTQITEQNILIGEQQCRIQNLEADSVKLQALIEQLTREVQSISKENDTSSFIQDLQNILQFVQDQHKKQEKSISVLQTQYREIRRGNLYQPAPAAERVANAANSQSAPAAASPAVPPPSGARAKPPTATATAFGSCPSALPRFVHGKTDVETWLSIAEDFMSIHNVRSEARVVAATLALDDTASKLVHANKRHTEANGHPFGWEEFKAAMLAAFLSQPPALEENQPISLICNHHYPHWMDNIRFFLHHNRLHSLDLRFTKPEHLRTLGPLIACSSASLTSLDLQLHAPIWRKDSESFTLGFLKACSQLQQLKLGRGEWKLNESCARAAWTQSLRSLTLAFVDRINLEYEFLDAITPQLTEFTLYEVSPSKCLKIFSHSFSFSNARIVRFLFREVNLKLTLNLPPSLETLSVMAIRVELTCQSDSPLALHQLILYVHDELRASLLCVASARVVYLNAPATYTEYHSLGEFSTEPSRWQDAPSASSNFSWMSWLRTVAPTVEVLIIEHEIPIAEMNVEWRSLRSLGIVVQDMVVVGDCWEIEKDRETTVEDIYRMNVRAEQGFPDGTRYADDPDPDELMGPPSINAPNLQALFFPSEGCDGEALATLKRNYPSLGLYCIVDNTFYWERKRARLIDAPLVHVRGKKGGSRGDTRKPPKTVKEKMHSVNKQLIEGYSVHDEEAYMLKVEKGFGAQVHSRNHIAYNHTHYPPQVHSRNKVLDDDVDFEAVAQVTDGMSGAELANVVDVAALRVLRENRSEVGGDG
ncbi:unnamed protein product [Closterium sp. Yama58-4]|nr:unnamed protein product [Closterium sp. Yama58-4]